MKAIIGLVIFEGDFDMKIGAQLYTLRDYCKDLESFSKTLEKIADIGYKIVQVSGTCEYEPEWLKKELEKNGLECVITHYPADKMIENPKKVAEAHEIFGCKYIGLGYYGFDAETEDFGYGDFVKKELPVAIEFSKRKIL